MTATLSVAEVLERAAPKRRRRIFAPMRAFGWRVTGGLTPECPPVRFSFEVTQPNGRRLWFVRFTASGWRFCWLPERLVERNHFAAIAQQVALREAAKKAREGVS